MVGGGEAFCVVQRVEVGKVGVGSVVRVRVPVAACKDRLVVCSCCGVPKERGEGVGDKLSVEWPHEIEEPTSNQVAYSLLGIAS